MQYNFIKEYLKEINNIDNNIPTNIVDKKNIIYVENKLSEKGFSEKETLSIIQDFNDVELSLLTDDEFIYFNYESLVQVKSSKKNPFIDPFFNNYLRKDIFNFILFKDDDFIVYSKKFKEKMIHLFRENSFKGCKNNSFKGSKNECDGVCYFFDNKTFTKLEHYSDAPSYKDKEGFFVYFYETKEKSSTNDDDSNDFFVLKNGFNKDNRYNEFKDFKQSLFDSKEHDFVLKFVNAFSFFKYEKSEIKLLLDKTINSEDKKELFNLNYKDSQSFLWKCHLYSKEKDYNEDEKAELSLDERQRINRLERHFTEENISNILSEFNLFLNEFGEEYTLFQFKKEILNNKTFKERFLKDDYYCSFSFNTLSEVTRIK